MFLLSYDTRILQENSESALLHGPAAFDDGGHQLPTLSDYRQESPTVLQAKIGKFSGRACADAGREDRAGGSCAGS